MWHDDHPPPHIRAWCIKPNCKTIERAHSVLSRLNEFKEPTVIKVLNARLFAPSMLEIDFSDHTQGLFDAGAYLASRKGPLLEKLRDPVYFQRFFIDAGALCWPNGLEISPAKVHELSAVHAPA
jgi:Protein of unknown function (DUF2442)